jgi:hypothetical protein
METDWDEEVDREALTARIVAAIGRVADYRLEGIAEAAEAAAARCPR